MPCNLLERQKLLRNIHILVADEMTSH